jgi:hypothetical protein
MAKATIKLAYQQVIDATATSDFERSVFDASYQEFLLKSQAYNQEGKFKTFSQLKANDGRANSLHYKLSFAVGYFINGLDNKIPQLKDNSGNSVAFEEPRFELIDSDIADKSTHKVAINYCTGLLTLLGVMGEYMVLAKGDVSAEEIADTFTLKMQAGLSIMYYKECVTVNNPKLNGQEVLMNV